MEHYVELEAFLKWEKKSIGKR